QFLAACVLDAQDGLELRRGEVELVFLASLQFHFVDLATKLGGSAKLDVQGIGLGQAGSELESARADNILFGRLPFDHLQVERPRLVIVGTGDDSVDGIHKWGKEQSGMAFAANILELQVDPGHVFQAQIGVEVLAFQVDRAGPAFLENQVESLGRGGRERVKG